MIIKPDNMSRRGFMRNVLGIATALILPARPRILLARDGYGGLYFPVGDIQGLYGLNFNRDDMWTGLRDATLPEGLWGAADSEADKERMADICNHFLLNYWRKNNPNKAFALC